MLDQFLSFIHNNPLDFLGSIIGIVYLYLEFTAKKSMWIVSIIMAGLYIYIFYTSQLYAMSLVYVYFLCASLYGWIQWNRHSTLSIRRMPRNQLGKVIGLVFVASLIIYQILTLFTHNPDTIAFGDALATALSFVAIWMAAKFWAEQWCLLIPANLLTAALLYSSGDYASSILFGLYCIASIFGLRHWMALAKPEH